MNDVKAVQKNNLDICNFKRIDAMKKIGITKDLYKMELMAAKKRNIFWIWILGIIVIVLAVILLVGGKINFSLFSADNIVANTVEPDL